MAFLMGKFFVTTPIYYINDKPHIGHAYATIAADVLARYRRQQGDSVLFTTGTDENSQKTVQAAEALGQPLDEYTNAMAKQWQQTWNDLGISYTKFIRTTEADHHKAVLNLIKRVEVSGDVYKDNYVGLYCVGHEAFMREDELVDGKCPDHNKAPETVKEENYFFRLSKYQDQLLNHIEAHPDFIQPESRRNEVVAFIKRGLQDFSISRSKKHWGIGWPGDKDQVVYVWFDALVNYLTASGFPDEGYKDWWPADLHIIGKDITKFHCIYWPAMLMSANIELPARVFGHGFFTVDGQKISKSLGNAVDPRELVSIYGVDALRYYLLREIPFGSDGEFTRERFETIYNTDLANELGNLVQRVAVMITKYFDGVIDEIPEHSHDVRPYKDAMDDYKFDKALAEIWRLIKGLNQYLEEEKPWALAKTDTVQLSEVLRHAVSDLGQIAMLLLPFLPTTAGKISATFADGKVHPEVGILFPKSDTIEKTEFQVK
jgi:methionyl-tRNA synthetase